MNKNELELRIKCSCGSNRKIEREELNEIISESHIIALAKIQGSDMVLFELKKCPDCSRITLERAVKIADARLMKEVNSLKPIAG